MKKHLTKTCCLYMLLTVTQVVTAQNKRTPTFVDMAQIQDQLLKSMHSIKAEINREQTFLDEA